MYVLILMRAYTHREWVGLGTPTVSQHNIFDSGGRWGGGESQVFLVLLMGSNLGSSNVESDALLIEPPSWLCVRPCQYIVYINEKYNVHISCSTFTFTYLFIC